MKFLIDQPVSPALVDWLHSRGDDACHVRDLGMAAASDEAIVDLALAESRILITTDLDFSRIVALSKKNGPAVILFRAGNITDDEMLRLLQLTIERTDETTLNKSIVVVNAHSIRVAKLPIR